MAIYHLNVKNISRGDGRSIVAAAAYRAGETLPNEAEERMSDFSGRRDVVAAEIRLPEHAPEWMGDRAKLWAAVEFAEKRKDARLGKEVEFALPRELPKSTWLRTARAMADAYTAKGFVVDLAIHDDGTRHNPHVHLLLTTRIITSAGFGAKIRSADGRQFVAEARVLWERLANNALTKAGIAATVDSRSYAKRKLERTPDRHRGPDKEERRARRAGLQREMPQMRPGDDHDLPVPDPDGAPIHPRQLDAAENRLLDDMHRDGPLAGDPAGDSTAARAAVDRQNAYEMTEDEAAAYRLAPENMLDWLDDAPHASESAQDQRTLERWENHLDWLEAGDDRPRPAPEDGQWHEPERNRR